MLKSSRMGLAGILVAVLLILAQGQVVAQAEFPLSPNLNGHVIQVGEDFWSIGLKFGVEPQALADANNMDLYEPLEVGQRLTIPEPGAKTHRVRAGENLWSIAASYGTTVSNLIRANKEINPDKLQVGQWLNLPASRTIASRGLDHVQTGFMVSFDWPVIGPLTSNFGMRKGEFHEGIDIAAAKGENVSAARGGTVIYSGWISGYGYTVKIDHGDGFVTLYAHNSKLLARQGEEVTSGQVIAKVGSSGRSTGPHLHFEVRYDGVAQNPGNFLKNTSTVAGID